MPLVVPGITNQSGDQSEQEQWTSKLVGKKIHEGEESNETLFAKRELPEKHRVIAPGQMVTKDFRQDRLNVHLNDEGTCTHVTYG